MVTRTATAAVVVSALAAATQASALASASDRAVAGSGCQRLLGLTDTELCVTVQAATSSVAPGGTASYSVGVSVTGGTAAAVTVRLTASAGQATFTAGCPGGNGTAQCGITSMALLGTPSSYQMQAQVPAGAAGTTVTLTATASTPTLLISAAPSAAASVAVTAPAAARSPSPSRSARPSPASGSPGPHGTPTPRTSSTGAGTVGAPGSAGFTGTFPPQISGPGFVVVGAGNATNLFPRIGPSPTSSPGFPSGIARAELAAEHGGMPLAPAGLVVGLVLAGAWLALVGPGYYRRHRTRE